MSSSGAAAAAAGSQKRKWDGKQGDEVDYLAASIEHSQRVTEELQTLSRGLVDKELSMGGTGGAASNECMRDVLEINVAGELMRARRSALCAAKGSVLAVMFCGKFDAGFIRDDSNRIFLQIWPPAFKWLVGELILYSGEQVDNVTLTPARQTDAPYKYWAELLLSDPSTKRRANDGAVAAGENDQQPPAHDGQQGGGQPQSDAEDLSVELTSMIRRAKADKAAQEARRDAIKPLLKTGNMEDDTLVSIDVLGQKITVTKAVAKSLGDDSTFANRFLKHHTLTVEAPPEHVQRVVDIVARAHMTGASITAADVQGARGDLAIKGYQHALIMYGLDADRYLGPIDGLLTTEHLHKMRQWCEGEEDAPAIPPCVGEPVIRIYKATVDGWRWLDFFDAVKGHSPLLLISKVADSNELFALIIEGPIEVTGAADSERNTTSYAFKLRGTESHAYVGGIGWNSGMYIAGTQERVTDLIDFSSPASNMTAVLSGSACLDFGVRLAAQIGAPAAASDEIMKRCQGFMREEGQPDEWRQWERPSVKPSDRGWDGDVVFLPVSVKGWQFEIDELEAYKLA
ncbi:unnamed protein product [Vitrella brassicaformis CCMP3155]|uniref:TLDc domain-containing protein n=2 Tax=Vitrella brassicaformis TaxID=1169539 RepID=A0A0G4H2C2_VITBC|nr:unnamed protein product [Vitrella brassicaformis CCMP3155]|eukprot:CEM37587.1 unnamed protein product [Vitrella brassicaformis CCMP3155]